MIEPDEYEAWTEHPITKLVIAELKKLADDRRDLWMLTSWNTGDSDPNKLAMLRGQAEAFMFLVDAPFEKVFGEQEA